MNSSGFFSEDSSTYTITRMFPPRPWRNYLFNQRFIACIDQFCFGGSWYVTPAGTRWYAAGGTDTRVIYVRDSQDGSFWAANRNYLCEPFEEFFCQVAQGFSRVVSLHRGIRASLELFIPPQGALEHWMIRVENATTRRRSISLFAHADTGLNGRGPIHNRAWFDDALGGIWLHHHAAAPESDLPSMFFVSDAAPVAYETTNRRFRGVHGQMSHPQAMGAPRLASQGTSYDALMAAVLQFDLELAPGQTHELHILLGLAADLDQARQIRRERLSAEAMAAEMAAAQADVQSKVRRACIRTPDRQIDAFANVWLKRQVDLGKTYGRVSAPRFRDIMQDVAAFVCLDAQTARQKICQCLEHQMPDGNTQRQWQPVDPHPYRDGPAWLVPTVAAYLKETGDWDFLQHQVEYLGGERGSILDHCRRALGFLLNGLGEHGLCLWGGGDWNDSLNAAGLLGRGESVWLSQATVAATGELAGLLERLGLDKEAAEFRQSAGRLTRSILEHAWERDHFICGFTDYGEKVGSYDNAEGRLFLNTQTWAVLAGIAPDAQALMDLVERELSCPWGYVLNKPSYTRGDGHIGRMTWFEPGCYENGSVYNHGVTFKIAADCRLGRGRLAYETVNRILPANPANPAARSGCEPYAITNMYLGPDNPFRAGESINSWTTGTAGWLHRCIIEMMLGVQADYDGLAVRPCLPPDWKEVSVRRQFRGAVYDIRILNPKGLQTGKVALTLDGRPVEGDTLPPLQGGQCNVLAELS